MMSSSSSEKVDKVEQVAKVCKPKWLDAFLNKTFFDLCTAHLFHKNELNRYCINCDLPVCQYCASSNTHHKHKILQIYRLVYKDAVTLAAMEKHIDCSQIQPYKCNKELVIALKPLPHTGSVKWNEESSCDTCGRKLAEPDLYRYCSISCKVEAALRKPNDSLAPSISIQSPPQKKNEETTKPQKHVIKLKKAETTEPHKHQNNEKEETTEPFKWLDKEEEEKTTDPFKWLKKEKEEETTKLWKLLNEEKEETTAPQKHLDKEKEETTAPRKRQDKEKEEETAESLKQLDKEKDEETPEPCKQRNEEKEEGATELPKRKHRRKGIPHRAPFF